MINCAAKTNVDALEANVDLAYSVNGDGPMNLAIACESAGSKLVQISTDYVFDGEGIVENGIRRPYVETDKPSPITVYGKSKYEGEMMASQYCHRVFIVRTAWLFGSGKRFIEKILNAAKVGEAVRVVNDQYGSATSVKELVQFLELLVRTEDYGIYHATCEGACTWYDVAKYVFESLNIETELLSCCSDDYKLVAKRPSYSVLENRHLKDKDLYRFSHWENAMDEYINYYLKT